MSVRRGGLMVSAFDSGTSCAGSSPTRGYCVVFSENHFTLTEFLFIQMFKWLPVNSVMVGNPAIDLYPIPQGGEGFMLTELSLELR